MNDEIEKKLLEEIKFEFKPEYSNCNHKKLLLKAKLQQHKETKKWFREMIISILSPDLKCIRNETNPDNCSCIACVRNSFRKKLKQRLRGWYNG